MSRAPIVLYMVPPDNPEAYGLAMGRLTENVQHDLKWPTESIELIGLIAASPENGTEGIFFLEEMGVDTRSLSLIVLWGETASSVEFEGMVAEDCGVGLVILPGTGVVLPTVRMPSIDSDWWLDPLHHAYAATTYAGLIKNGSAELTGTEPYIFIACPSTWN